MTSAQLFYEVARLQTEEQDKRRLHFDTVTAGVLTLSVALLGVIAFTVKDWADWSIYPFVASLASFVLIASSAFLELRPRPWLRQPPLAELEEHLRNDQYDDTRVVGWTARQMSKAVSANEGHLKSKADWMTRALYGLVAHILFVGTLIVSALGQ